MKKILCFISLTIFLLLISGCNNNQCNHLDYDNNNICDICNHTIDKEILSCKDISTETNKVLKLTKRTTPHYENLTDLFYEYNQTKLGLSEYQIFSLIEKEDSLYYNIDIFEVQTIDETLYFLIHDDDFYFISPFPLHNQNSVCVSSIAITDANSDGFIEIFTAISSYNKNYATSYVQVTDTFTKQNIGIFVDDSICYFKENENNIISIYTTNKMLPQKEDIVDGKLSEDFKKFATKLYETPELNTSTYHFKSMEYSASCSLFDVNITVLEDSIKFPYYFEKTYTPISFKINVEMTYLGESFSYTSGNGYLEGANIKFINKTNKIIHEPILAPDVVTEFYIYTGMKITDVYEFTDGNPKNEAGIYDMIISYKDEEIVVKDFLNLAR